MAETPKSSFSLRTLQTVSRIEKFVQPQLNSRIVTKLVQTGSHYYTAVKDYSPLTAQAFDTAEKLVSKASTEIQTRLQTRINQNAARIESLDQYGVRILDRVEDGKAEVEKILLRPALFLLTVLNHIYFMMKGSQTEEVSSSQKSSIEPIEVLPEASLTELYKIIGQRAGEIGSELHKSSHKLIEEWGSSFSLGMNQFPILSNLVSKVINLAKPSKLIVIDENEQNESEKKEN